MIGEDGRMNEAAGERFAGLTTAEARGGRGRRAARAGAVAGRGGLPALGAVLASLRRADRAADLAAVVLLDGRAGGARDRRRRARRGPDRLRQLQARLPRLDAKHPALVRLAPALVGPPGCRSGTRRRARRSSPSPSSSHARRRSSGESIPTRCARRPTSSTPGSAPRCGRSRPSAGRTDAPRLRAFYPTDVLTTAREIIFLWVARMVMMGIEFAGDDPVRATSTSPGDPGAGRPPDVEVARHRDRPARRDRRPRRRRAALRPAGDVVDPGRPLLGGPKVQQGRDLANKIWNASRLILLNAGDARPERRAVRVEDRWILSRLERAVASVSGSIDSYDFAHAALDFYAFFWSELCDWYLEIVKPRLYDGDEDAAANLLWVLERVLAVAHPLMPFVTEEVWGYLPDREQLAARLAVPCRRRRPPRPGARSARSAPRSTSSAPCGAGATSSGCRRAACCAARVEGDQPHELVARLARLRFDGLRRRGAGDDPRGRDPRLRGDRRRARPRRRIEAERERLRAEIERLERKLANQGFVAKAPPEVVEDERRKLDGYRAELEELG